MNDIRFALRIHADALGGTINFVSSIFNPIPHIGYVRARAGARRGWAT